MSGSLRSPSMKPEPLLCYYFLRANGLLLILLLSSPSSASTTSSSSSPLELPAIFLVRRELFSPPAKAFFSLLSAVPFSGNLIKLRGGVTSYLMGDVLVDGFFVAPVFPIVCCGNIGGSTCPADGCESIELP